MENRRAAKRAAFNKAVEYSGSGEILGGSIAGNISLSGISLKVQNFIPIGTTLELQIHIGPLSKVIWVKGQVVRVRSVLSDDCYEIGLKFINDDEDNIRTMGAYIVNEIN